MASCVCGAPIRWAERVDTGEQVPLDYHAELGPGESRFIIVGVRPNGHHAVSPIRPQSDIEGYVDHRIDCPDHGNGLVAPS